MQNFRALNPRASGRWGLCPQTSVGLRQLGASPPDPIGLRRLGAQSPDPQNSPPLWISGYAPVGVPDKKKL